MKPIETVAKLTPGVTPVGSEDSYSVVYLQAPTKLGQYGGETTLSTAVAFGGKANAKALSSSANGVKVTMADGTNHLIPWANVKTAMLN